MEKQPSHMRSVSLSNRPSSASKDIVNPAAGLPS